MNLRKMLLGTRKSNPERDSVVVVKEATRSDFRSKIEALELEALRVFGDGSRKREEPTDG